MRWFEQWGWFVPDPEEEPVPRSFDIGLITPAQKDRLLDAIRRHQQVDKTKKELTDLLETAQPTDMEPGRFRWDELEREVERMGSHWTWADVLERWGLKK